MYPHNDRPSKGLHAAYLICWLLGLGSLFPWNSMLTIEDYYSALFPKYHPTRVLTLIYQPFALLTISILAYKEARINTRLRISFGFCLFFLSSLYIPILDLATSGHSGLGTFVGICLASALFGIADAHVQGGMVGELSYMRAEFLQSFSAGLAASGVATSGLRMITKASFENSPHGLRKGALAFFFISTFFVLMCLLLYAYVFPHLEIIKYYRTRAASEGAKSVTADLAAAGLSTQGHETDNEAEKCGERLSTLKLLVQNSDFAADLFLVYAITLIALFNVGDFVGRYIPLIDLIRLESRVGLMVAALSRFALIPSFYFTANYGSQGWMLLLCIILGLSNGYLTVCVLVIAPNGYKGPEQNALGNLLVLFLLSGILVGVTFDWLWLIGKGW